MIPLVLSGDHHDDTLLLCTNILQLLWNYNNNIILLLWKQWNAIKKFSPLYRVEFVDEIFDVKKCIIQLVNPNTKYECHCIGASKNQMSGLMIWSQTNLTFVLSVLVSKNSSNEIRIAVDYCHI